MKISPFWKSTGERMWRGGLAAVVAAYVAGNLVFNVTSIGVNAENALSLFVGGAATSLLLCLGGQAATGNGPSFTKAEKTEPKKPRVRNQAGVVNIDILLIISILTFVGVLLLLFRVHFAH